MKKINVFLLGVFIWIISAQFCFASEVIEELNDVENQNEEYSRVEVELQTDTQGYQIIFSTSDQVLVTIYEKKDDQVGIELKNTDNVVARNGDTGEIDITGDGQINFSVEIMDGYSLESVNVIEGAGNYKNIKLISENGNRYLYRITKICGPITIGVYTKECVAENTDSLIEEIQWQKNKVSPYYENYCTEESVQRYQEYIQQLDNLDLSKCSATELNDIIEKLTEVREGLCYKTSIVPQVYITTTDGVGNNLVKDMGYVSANIAIVDEQGKVLEEAASIKVRGNSTAGAPKKPYNIKFSSKQDVLGMGKAKKWCLLANCFDASLMRNAIAFNIAAQMEIPYTSEITYSEVWVDGVYKGCYQLCENVEVGSTRVDIDISRGDFLLQIEKSRDEEGVKYFVDNNNLRYAFKEPEEPTDEQYAHVKEVMNYIADTLNSGDYSQVCKVIDIDSMAKFYILNEYIRNYDFNFSSTYFYYKGGKLYAGPVWDFDLSSGNSENENRLRIDYASASMGNIYPFLLKYSEFQAVVREYYNRYEYVLNSVACDGGLIDTYLAQYRTVYERNFIEAGWDISHKYHEEQGVPYETIDENVLYLKKWLSERKVWMDQYMKNMIPNVWVESVLEEKNCILIEWRELENIEKYAVYRKSEDEDWKRIATVGKQSFYRDYSAEANKLYLYDVVAIVNDQRGSLSYVGYKGQLSEKEVISFSINNQPASLVVEEGEAASFAIEASGEGLSYMWYVKTPDSERFIKTGISDTVYTRKIYQKTDGLQVYCVVKDAYGKEIISDIATVSINNGLRIIQQPQDVFVEKQLSKFKVSVKAKGTDVEYSWYYKNAYGDGKFHKAGVYTSTYERTASILTDGMQVYCVVTDSQGARVITDIVTVYIGKVEVELLGEEVVHASKNQKVNFEALAKAYGQNEDGAISYGVENIDSYSWYSMIPVENGGDGIFHKTGYGSFIYTRTASEKIDGMQVYCVVKDKYGNKAQSKTVTVSVD